MVLFFKKAVVNGASGSCYIWRQQDSRDSRGLGMPAPHLGLGHTGDGGQEGPGPGSQSGQDRTTHRGPCLQLAPSEEPLWGLALPAGQVLLLSRQLCQHQHRPEDTDTETAHVLTHANIHRGSHVCPPTHINMVRTRVNRHSCGRTACHGRQTASAQGHPKPGS